MSQPEPFDDENEAFIKTLVATYVPKAVTSQEIEAHVEKDMVLKDLVAALEGGQWTEAVKCFKPFESKLFRSVDLMRSQRIIVPESLRSRILQLAHESHPGIISMKRKLRQKVWWPGMHKQVEKIVKSCKSCMIVSALDPPEPMRSTCMPESSGLRRAITVWMNLLVIVDYFSRFIEVIVLKEITAATTVKAFDETFCRFGMPETLKTDNGPQFRNGEFKSFCQEYGIEVRKSTPYWPQANGEVERVNGMIKKHLRISQVEDTDWKWNLQVQIQLLTPPQASHHLY
ncbi:uncharacterized protein K02A2.6-like [Armigeres subalbatus]|uniref:uncharacterized protein K02A2.6-like n=1 Tax=Armigeres subalbatus TaxID=124917 RepID=UPI002ED2726B